MSKQNGYAVLRFVDKNGYCHTVHDYVQGELLIYHIRENPRIKKDRFFRWIDQIVLQAIQFYKCSDEDTYGALNPYAFVLTEEEGVLFLDIKDEANEALVKTMQHKTIRALFMRKERVLSLKTTLEDDMYSLGRTIQFMCAKCMTEPILQKREEKILKKIVHRCQEGQKKQVKDLKEISKEVKKLHRDRVVTERKRTGGKWVLAVVVALVALVVCWQFSQDKRDKPEEKKITLPEKVEDVQKIERNDREYVQAKLENGLLYYTELEDERRSRESLQEIKEESKLAEAYLNIFTYLQNGDQEIYAERELEGGLKIVLEELEALKKEESWEEKQELYEIPLVRAFSLLHTEYAYVRLRELCTGLLANNKWKEKQNGMTQEIEMRTHLASVCEEQGEGAGAIEQYEILKEKETDENKLEQIYMKLGELYGSAGEREKQWEILREGTEKVKESSKLWILYLEKCCGNTEIERTVCAQYVEEALQAIPDLLELEEFKKLQAVYAISIEEGKVCVGK